MTEVSYKIWIRSFGLIIFLVALITFCLLNFNGRTFIGNSGAYFVGGKTVNQQELLLLLTSSVLNNPSQTVVIRADQRVEFVFVATAMDLCNQAGIFDYTVATSGEM